MSDATTVDWKLVASGLQFPEAPVAMADGTLLFVEIEGQRLSRLYPDGRSMSATTAASTPSRTSRRRPPLRKRESHSPPQ